MKWIKKGIGLLAVILTSNAMEDFSDAFYKREQLDGMTAWISAFSACKGLGSPDNPIPYISHEEIVNYDIYAMRNDKPEVVEEEEMSKKDKRCPYCRYRFAKLCGLMRHLSCVHDKEGRFKCDVCLKNFYFKCDLDTHRRRALLCKIPEERWEKNETDEVVNN